MKKLVWKLSKLPEAEELKTLVEAKILTTQEAKEIVVRQEEEKQIDKDELKDVKDELKLLRELVLKMAAEKPQPYIQIVERYIERLPYRPSNPWGPYITWSSQTTGTSYNLTSGGNKCFSMSSK